MKRSRYGFSTKCPVFIFNAGFMANEKYLSILKVNKESEHRFSVILPPFFLLIGNQSYSSAEKLFYFTRETRKNP